jgi:hypothetical protein
LRKAPERGRRSPSYSYSASRYSYSYSYSKWLPWIRQTTEAPGRRVEYEYRCTEYEYEYDKCRKRPDEFSLAELVVNKIRRKLRLKHRA